MIYHALIIIPFGDKLTGRQKAALGIYEQCGSNSNSGNNKKFTKADDGSTNENDDGDKCNEEEEEESMF